MKFIIHTPLHCKNTLIVTVECVYTEEGQHWRAVYTQCTEGPLFCGLVKHALFVMTVVFLLVSSTMPRALLLAVDSSYNFNEPNSIAHACVDVRVLWYIYAHTYIIMILCVELNVANINCLIT